MEPERPIEKVLRAAAAKRRAAAGESPSLHPADRRVLQAEVAKAYGSARGAQSSSHDRFRLWHHLGWSFAVLAGLAIAASMMLPQPQTRSFTLAQNEARESGRLSLQPSADSPSQPRPGRVETVAPGQAGATAPLAYSSRDESKIEIAGVSREAEAMKPPSPTQAPAASTPVASDRLAPESRLRSTYSSTLSEKPQNAPAIASSSPSSSSGVKSKMPLTTGSASGGLGQVTMKSEELAQSRFFASNGERKLVDSSNQQLAAAAPPPAAASALVMAKDSDLDHLALADKKASSSSRQKFVQVRSDSLRDNALTPENSAGVLSSFEFQQQGPAIHIIDHDGSVYDGAVDSLATVNRRFAEGPATRYRAPSESAAFYDQSAAPSLTFTASGTNRTSGALVVFKGSMVNANTSTLQQQKSVSAVMTTNAVANPPLMLTNAQISGSLRIGLAAPVPLKARAQDAASEPPPKNEKQ
jgi:hypothetical protein